MKTHTNKEQHIKEDINTQVTFITGHLTLLVAHSTNTKRSQRIGRGWRWSRPPPIGVGKSHQM